MHCIRPMQRIIAFVVGISDYPKSKLKNAVNDADKIRRILEAKRRENPKRVKIFYVQDCDVDALQAAQNEYLKELKEYDLALFFFAGHACMFNNSPRLLTIPKQSAAMDVETDSVNVYLLLSRWVEPRHACISESGIHSVPH